MSIMLKRQFVQWKGLPRRYRILWIYAVTSIVSVALSLLYSFCIPTAYTAEAVLVDENTEMDVLIGLSRLGKLNNDAELWDKGINDIEIYAQQIDSREFALEVSKIRVPGYDMDFLEYVKRHYHYPWWHLREYESDDEEALKQISECIRSRVVAAKQKFKIQFIAPDPVVSAIMVDSVCNHLQKMITAKRIFLAKERYNYLARVCADARNDYLRCQALFSAYSETHRDSRKMQEKSHIETLRKNKKTAYDNYVYFNSLFLRQKMLLENKTQSFYTLKKSSVPVRPSNPQFVFNILSFLAVTLLLTTLGVLYKFVDNSGRKLQFGNSFSPWSITIGIWSAILIALFFESGHLYPLSNQFYWCLAIWVPVFGVSSFTTFNLLPRLPQSVRSYMVTEPFNSVVFNFFFVISVVITPLYLFSILKIVSLFGTEEFLSNIRVLAVHGNESFGYLSLSYVLNQALLVMALWQYPRIPLWKLLTIYCMTFMSAFAIMEKGLLFYMIIITLFVLYEKRLLRTRSIVLSLSGIVLLLFAINLMRFSKESGYAENTTLLDFFVTYSLSPPVAFGTLSQDISLLPGSHTFQAFYKLLNRWGLGNFDINTEWVQEFVYVPIPTNIYTVFQPFFEDFKYRGVAFFALVYGMFSGWMYRLYQNGNAVGKAIYTYLIYFLTLQFYQEYLFQTIIQCSHFVILVMLVQQRFIGFSQNICPQSPRY